MRRYVNRMSKYVTYRVIMDLHAARFDCSWSTFSVPVGIDMMVYICVLKVVFEVLLQTVVALRLYLQSHDGQVNNGRGRGRLHI